jgi:hypothetical protein
VTHHTPDLLHLLTREHHAKRMREADAERLYREIRGTARSRWRVRLPVAFRFGMRRRKRRAGLAA